MLHAEVLEPSTLGILTNILDCESFNSFNLVGGTALALQFETNNLLMLLKSLTYFDDVEATETPVLLTEKVK